jgi:hypothetical protein
VTEVRPALGFETFLETMFALAADGSRARRGCRTRSGSW